MVSQKINSVVAGSVLAASLVCATSGAYAYGTGDLILRAGAVSVQPDEESSTLKVNGAPLSGTKAEVDGDTQLGLTGTYMLSPNVGIGLLLATPFEHDVEASGNILGNGVKAGSVKQLPPTLTVQFFPMASSSAFQPYVGAGVNYTKFFSEKVDSEVEAAIGSSGGSLVIQDTVGLALEAGFDYALDAHWLVSAQVWYIDIEADDARFKFSSGPVSRVDVDVDIDPWVYMLSVGYKF